MVPRVVVVIFPRGVNQDWLEKLIRQAVRELTRELEPPRPRLPLFEGGDPTLAERVEEELAKGFGEW